MNSNFPEIPDESSTLTESYRQEENTSLGDSCTVVGIGASAGGLEAFQQLLQNLPDDTGWAFVLIQHLDPKHESSLAEILARYTAMPLNQAIHGTKVEPNHVYVIPPNATMEIRDGILSLSPRGETAVQHLPIDSFLCSLAEDQKSRAVGVILSGSASDGTAGLKAIKSAGGITFAQDESAKFDSMPRNAVTAGTVDFILPPVEIARELASLAKSAFPKETSPGISVENGPVLKEILSLLRNAKTVDFTYYKTPTITRRLSRRMALHQKSDAASYLALLKQDTSEVNALFDDLLIHVTEFFRDGGVFDVLEKTVFPAMLNGRVPDEPIRIWVPGCATGEEVYSIAICLSEYLSETGQSLPIKIFGTDISDRAIETARAGKYSENVASAVSPERLSRFFVKLETGGFQIARSIRELCVFSRHDLTSDAPLSKMDVISCRNLLIYLGSVLQKRVLATFSYALQPTGCLVLGHSESLGSLADYFVELDRHHKIYTRNLRLAPPTLHFDRIRTSQSFAALSGQQKSEDGANLLETEANRIVSEEYGPSGFLVDSNHQVLKFRGEVGPYVAQPAGTATLDLFRLIHDDVVPMVRAAFDEAAARNAPVRKEHVPLRRDNQVEQVNIVVRPILKFGAERHFLILFEEAIQQNGRGQGLGRSIDSADRELSEELASTRAYLQTLIEELRSANEEAQSANEELQSTNEELQTAKEELQSSNEELTTTNEEMKSRNTELGHVNDDLLNLLSSMRVPVVMLNKELRIRRFTPLAEKALNLITSDVGRPITDLKPRINVPDLEQLLAKVIHSLKALEQDVQDQEGRWYSMRINPYRTVDNKVEGAVLQLLDIDQLKHTVDAAEAAQAYAEAIFETVREPLVVLDRKGHIQTANRSFFETFGVAAEDTLHHSIFKISNGQWNSPKVHRLLDRIVSPEKVQLGEVEVEHHLQAVGLRTFQLNARMLNTNGGEGQILLALEDITDRKRAAEAKYRRLFETAKDGILVIDAESGEITDANAFILDLFGQSRQQLVGKRFWKAGPLAAIPDGRGTLKRLLAEEIVRLPDLPVTTKDGRRIDVEAIGNVYSEGEKRVIQFNIRDITGRKLFDSKLQQTAKLESLGLLAGGVAHDFNNLLTGIMGNASLILDRADAGNPDREQLREIVKATRRAADLTRQMLAYSGRGRFVVEMVDMSELVRDIGSLVRSSVPKTVDFELNLASDLPLVKADATQMQQIVMNLALNGAEAIGEGKRGVVRLTTGQEELNAEAIHLNFLADDLDAGTYVTLEVTDSGSGMDDATKAKIFDPFFTTKFTGRGLGLSAVLGIVRGHRGSIRVSSAPGRGTTFKLLLPASPAAQGRKAISPQPEDLRGTGLVLVVDDEEAVLRLAAPALQRYGYEVLTAQNGAEAVRIVRERGQELTAVILDLTMPVMGGEEALLQMKAILPSLPVVLSSGYDQRQAAKRLEESDLAGFIQKPYSVQKLLETVKAILR